MKSFKRSLDLAQTESKAEVLRQTADGATPQKALEAGIAAGLRKFAEERGAMNIKMLEGMFIGVVLLVVLVTFMWNQGLPMIITATSNTTALTDAGADANQVSWLVFAGSTIFIFIVIGVLIAAIRNVVPSGGGGGGGRRWRWRRRK